MTSLINSLIAEKEEEIRIAKEEQERERTATFGTFLVDMKEFLGDFYTFLEERAKRTGDMYSYKTETNHLGDPLRIYYYLPAMPEEELAPIVIRWGSNSRHKTFHDYNERFRTGNSHFSELKEALRAAREYYPEYLEEIRKEASRNFHTLLPWQDLDVPEDVVRKILDAHLAKWPDLESEAREDFQTWRDRREREIRDRKRAQIERETREARDSFLETLRISYTLDLAKYFKNFEATLEANQAIAQRIQDVSDSHPYTVYQLTYAYMARWEEDEEEYREVNTKTIWTLDERPDSAGYWNIAGKKINFLNVVSVEKKEVIASSGILAKHKEVGGVGLWFDPEVREDVIDMIVSEIQALPQEPEVPEGLDLDHYDRQEIRSRARLYNETNEIPF